MLVVVPVLVLASLSAGTVVGGAELKPVAVSGPPHAASRRLAAAHRWASGGARNIARAYRRSSAATTLRVGTDLEDVKAPRLELTPGTAACNALGYNRDGALVIGAEVRNDPQGNDMWIFAASDAASPLVHYLKRNGADNGNDRVVGLYCDYMCGWVGAETVDGASQWIAGMIRG